MLNLLRLFTPHFRSSSYDNSYSYHASSDRESYHHSETRRTGPDGITTVRTSTRRPGDERGSRSSVRRYGRDGREIY